MALVMKAAALLVLARFAFPASDPLVVHAGPGVFHSQVRSAIMPAYPRQSTEVGHSGLAVADVHVSTTGTVLDVKVLQAPDSAIGSELIKAVSKWSFRPTLTIPDKTPVEIVGRVIFSFSLKNGTPEVTDLVAEHIRASAEKK